MEFEFDTPGKPKRKIEIEEVFVTKYELERLPGAGNRFFEAVSFNYSKICVDIDASPFCYDVAANAVP